MNKIPSQLDHKEYIKCTPVGVFMGNNKCHWNCLSWSLRNKTKAKCIVGVGQVFSDGTMVAHFVVELNDGTYIDPSIGNLAGVYDDYLIPIEKYNIDTFKPNRELVNLKEYLFSLRSFWFRLLHKNPY